MNANLVPTNVAAVCTAITIAVAAAGCASTANPKNNGDRPTTPPVERKACSEDWTDEHARAIAEAGNALMEGAATRAAAGCTGATRAECDACIDAQLKAEAQRLRDDVDASAALLEAAMEYGATKCPAEDTNCIMDEAERCLRDRLEKKP